LTGGSSAWGESQNSVGVGESVSGWSVNVHNGALSAEVEIKNVVVILSPWSQDSTVAASNKVASFGVCDDKVVSGVGSDGS